MTAEDRGRWLTDQLWDCTDLMPSWLCADLDLRQGSTYASYLRCWRKS
jgi:hypothetical protein